MFESIGRSLALVKTGWSILMADKKLLVFPILSGIVTIAVILTFVLPLLVTGAFMSMSSMGPVLYYGAPLRVLRGQLFCRDLLQYGIDQLRQCTAEREGDVHYGGSLKAARHLPAIIGWAILSATVGLILHLLQERAGFIGDIVLSIIGGVWSLVTFFVVPVLILEDKGVFESLKESVDLIKKTWGESIVGSAGMAVVFVMIGVIAASVFWPPCSSGMRIIFGVALALFLIFIVLLAVIYYAMQGIFVTALYTYAKTGAVPPAFNSDLIQNAFAPRNSREPEISETFFFEHRAEKVSRHSLTTGISVSTVRVAEQYTERGQNMHPRCGNHFTHHLKQYLYNTAAPHQSYGENSGLGSLPGKTTADKLVSLGIEKRRILDIRLLEEISATYKIPVYLFFEDDLARTRTLESVQEEYQSGSRIRTPLHPSRKFPEIYPGKRSEFRTDDERVSADRRDREHRRDGVAGNGRPLPYVTGLMPFLDELDVDSDLPPQ